MQNAVPERMHIFAEQRLSDVLDQQRSRMLAEIINESPNRLLNVNESDFINYLTQKYSLESLVFDFSRIQVSHSEKMIPAEQHPFDFGVHYSPIRKSAYP